MIAYCALYHDSFRNVTASRVRSDVYKMYNNVISVILSSCSLLLLRFKSQGPLKHGMFQPSFLSLPIGTPMFFHELRKGLSLPVARWTCSMREPLLLAQSILAELPRMLSCYFSIKRDPLRKTVVSLAL